MESCVTHEIILLNVHIETIIITRFEITQNYVHALCACTNRNIIIVFVVCDIERETRSRSRHPVIHQFIIFLQPFSPHLVFN